MTLADVLRYMATEAMKSPEKEITVPVWQILVQAHSLDADERRALQADFDKRVDLVASEKRLTNSYITNTCNRMKEMIAADLSITTKRGEDEGGNKTLTLGVKPGAMKLGSRSKSENIAAKNAVQDFARRIMAIAPALDSLADDRVAGAVDGVRMMKELIAKEAGL